MTLAELSGVSFADWQLACSVHTIAVNDLLGVPEAFFRAIQSPDPARSKKAMPGA